MTNPSEQTNSEEASRIDAAVRFVLARIRWIRRHHLRIDQITIQIADYDNEVSLRMLKPDEPALTLKCQRRMNQAIIQELESRGAKVRAVKVHAAAYLRWLSEHELVNNAGNRAQYVSWITSPEPRFLPLKIWRR